MILKHADHIILYKNNFATYIVVSVQMRYEKLNNRKLTKYCRILRPFN